MGTKLRMSELEFKKFLAEQGTNGKIYRECIICGRFFYIAPGHDAKYKKSFCSEKCRASGIQGERNPNWRGGKVVTNCLHCGNRIESKPSKIERGEGKFCNRLCFSLYRSRSPEMTARSTARGGKRKDLNDRYFRSAWEANWARYLNLLVKWRQIKGWEYEPTTFEFLQYKKGTRFYTPDFKILNLDGSHEWHEIKGYMDAKSATKLKRMVKNYPNEKVVMIMAKEYYGISGQFSKLIPGWEKETERPTRSKRGR